MSDYRHEEVDLGPPCGTGDVYYDPEGNVVPPDVIVGSLNLVPRLRARVGEANLEMGEFLGNVCEMLVNELGWDQEDAMERLGYEMVRAEDKVRARTRKVAVDG